MSLSAALVHIFHCWSRPYYWLKSFIHKIDYFYYLAQITCLFQFMNKVLYAREGAKSIMDRTFADFSWQVRVEVDGVEVEVPEVSAT